MGILRLNEVLLLNASEITENNKRPREITGLGRSLCLLMSEDGANLVSI